MTRRFPLVSIVIRGREVDDAKIGSGWTSTLDEAINGDWKRARYGEIEVAGRR